MSGWNDNLRVHYDRPGDLQADNLGTRPAERTAAQKAQDQILEHAEKAALEALDKTVEAIEWLSIVSPVTARSAPVYLRQLLAEIVEVRRVRQ